MTKLVKLEWEKKFMKTPDILQGYFVKVGKRYFPFKLEMGYMTNEDNKIVKEVNIDINENGLYEET